jgi:cell division protein FtsB
MDSKWVRFWAIVNGALVVLLVGAAVFGDRGVVRHERLAEELHRLEALNDRLRDHNQELRREIEQLKHDHNYVEAVVRDELGWVRADEMVFIVPGSDEANSK